MDDEFVPSRLEDELADGVGDEPRRGSAILSFGLRASALAGMVAPVAMVVGGIAVGLLQSDIMAPAYTTCCPLG